MAGCWVMKGMTAYWQVSESYKKQRHLCLSVTSPESGDRIVFIFQLSCGGRCWAGPSHLTTLQHLRRCPVRDTPPPPPTPLYSVYQILICLSRSESVSTLCSLIAPLYNESTVGALILIHPLAIENKCFKNDAELKSTKRFSWLPCR